jgi:dephospho-CoA kinase
MSKKHTIIFLDIPLLFEEYDKLKEFDIVFDEIWLVYIEAKTQIQRLIKRDNISREDAINRINSQINIEKKKHIASEILDNSGTIEELKKQTEELFKRL